MAVNSKADKTHGHTAKSIQGQVGVSGGSAPLKTASYSAAPPPATGISQAGTKALQFRARKVLAPLADPSQPLTE